MTERRADSLHADWVSYRDVLMTGEPEGSVVSLSCSAFAAGAVAMLNRVVDRLACDEGLTPRERTCVAAVLGEVAAMGEACAADGELPKPFEIGVPPADIIH